MSEAYENGYAGDFKRRPAGGAGGGGGAGGAGGEGGLTESAGEYLRTLLAEKIKISQGELPAAVQLVDHEITRVQTEGRIRKPDRYIDVTKEKPIKVTAKVVIPVKEHPKFNFVGKLLGPKGLTMKQLQEETLCKMAVLGRGSMKDRQKEEELRSSLDPKYAHLSDELHVEISALGPPAEAHARIAYALAEVRKYLIPDVNDPIRQGQMHHMMERHSYGPPQPPPMSHRPMMPAKSKVLSILDRARTAMVDPYGGRHDDPYGYPEPPVRTQRAPEYYTYEPHYPPQYEEEAYYKEPVRKYKTTTTSRDSGVRRSGAGGAEPGRGYSRGAPYARPSK